MRTCAGLSLWLSICCIVVSSCTRQRDAGKSIFRYNESAGISSLDPAMARNQANMWPVHQLFNTLVELDSQMRIRPSLAKRWELSDDRLQLRFYLRDDVYFHDDPCFPGGKGRKLVAKDVAYSLQRVMDPFTASPGAWIFNDRLDSLQPFLAINDSTLYINLKRPFQPMLQILTMKYCSVIAPESVGMYGKDVGRHPVGTGPFVLTAWHEGEAVILKKNTKYFEKDATGNALPYLDAVFISFAGSKLAEFLEFRQDRLDFLNDLDASIKDEVLMRNGTLKPVWNGKVMLQKGPYLNTEYLGILTEKNIRSDDPLSKLSVRKAIAYAINREKMLIYLRNAIGTAAHSGFVPPGLPSYNPERVKGYRYDPELARTLIREAGYDSKHPMPTIKLITIPNYAALGSFIVNELQQAGIPASVEVVQKSLLLEQMAAGSVSFFRGSWIADYPDAENYLSVFYGSNPAPPNYTRFRDAAFDHLYQTSLAEPNDSIRYGLYQKMDSLVMRSLPVIPLWYDQVLHLVKPGISGFPVNSLNMLELRQVKKNATQ